MILILSFNPAHAQEKQEVDEIQQQVEKYKKECENKSYPVNDKDKMDYIFSYYNSSIKEYLPKYNNCLKEIIIEKIKHIASQKDTKNILEALNKIEQGILDFYSTIAMQTDTGIVGKAWNDNELGRYYEQTLYNVLWYQEIYGEKLE